MSYSNRLVRQSPVAPKKVAPFVVKRKQINFNLLDPVQPSPSPSLPPLIRYCILLLQNK